MEINRAVRNDRLEGANRLALIVGSRTEMWPEFFRPLSTDLIEGIWQMGNAGSVPGHMSNTEANAELHGVELLSGAAVVGEPYVDAMTEVGAQACAEAVIFGKSVADHGRCLLINRCGFSFSVA